jgi:long-chain acyl-CoA synthetase
MGPVHSEQQHDIRVIAIAGHLFGPMTPPHVIELLDSAAKRWPAKIFVRGEQLITFAQMSDRSRAIAYWLVDRGFRPGDRILIAARNHGDAIAAALGATRAGMTFAYLHHLIRPAGFRRIATQMEPVCVVLDASTAHLKGLTSGVSLLVAGGTEISGGTAVSKIVSSEGWPVSFAKRADPFCLVYTSGSTGEPRGVMVSHDNVLFTAQAIQSRLQYRADDAIGLFLPLSFDYGLYQLFLSLITGASVYLATQELTPLRIADALAREKITVLPGIPSLFSALIVVLNRTGQSFPCLRSITNTGEHLAEIVIDNLGAVLPGVEVFSMYGLTECKRISILLPSERRGHPGSVGRPLDGTTAEVLREDGTVAPPDTPGELVVGGPHVTMGYWRAPEETDRRFRPDAQGQRLLFTGDTCRRSREGYLYFCGRHDTQIKRHGFRMSLLEVESAALTLAEVREAAAISLSENDGLHLFVVAATDCVSAGTVLRHLRDQLEPYKVPDRIQVVESLPLTPHGKVDRENLRTTAAGVG